MDKFISPNVRYQCRHPDCSLSFKRSDQLHSHEFSHTQIKRFKCLYPDCDKAYVNNAHLRRHAKKSHLTNTKAEGKNIPCKFGPPCTRQYKSKEKMLLHYRKVHIEKTDNKSLSLKCDLCDEVFRRKAQHRLHIFEHTGNYPYKCTKCEKGFLNHNCLVRHEKTHKSYKCSECSEEFHQWSKLVTHKHTAHPSTNIKCTICGREFRSKNGLRCHRGIHEQSERRFVYQCLVEKCPKYFFHRQNLLAHQKSKHENRKFICDVGGCGRELCSKQKLEIHMKVIHFNDGSSRQKPITDKKLRAPRKDKGIPKTSTASRICNIVAPTEIEKLIIAGRGNQIHLEYNVDENGDAEEAVVVVSNINENIAKEVTVQ